MAVRMRLTRIGSKKNPIYRVVVADSRSPRDGKFIEIVGRYNPQTDPSTIELKEDRVKDWLNKGAQPTESVRKLLVRFGVEESRVTTEAFGDTKPRIKGFSVDALRENRRVEFIITKTRPAETP